jgi:hypothetical protein
VPLPEKTCVSCGKRFALLPNKPGLVNTCPQCSVPPVEIKAVVRKPRKKRQKSREEQFRDTERKVRKLDAFLDAYNKFKLP